jgi:hypothetical protein
MTFSFALETLRPLVVFGHPSLGLVLGLALDYRFPEARLEEIYLVATVNSAG